MTAPIGPRNIAPTSPWATPTSAESYRVAALRAAAISVVLLAGLVLLILF